MCLKSKAILLSALFAFLSAVPLHSQSSKDLILSQLTEYQTSLQIVKQQVAESRMKISESQEKIASLQKLIDSLKQQLEDSKNTSQTMINELKKQLVESELRLTMQLEDLAKQEADSKILNQQLELLSKDCQRLQNSLRFYRNIAAITTGITLIEGVYIIGKSLGWWK